MEMPRDQRGFMYMDKVPRRAATANYFRKMPSLCTVDTALSEPGTQVEVLWDNPGKPQKSIRATVAPASYKKDNRRADLQALS